ncbi:hypothetical protein KVR01_004669 [Diaporthe batatas]|uniref:uncharacterized protein n=1 Tax=Diaporthe batatas TaxID=748121 RepID=UPI001D05665D|nr:uncharacterized protein KVR01_004669 [Diaporthe batatas]KAG8166117.1 hypothetical protein KVR01_004669 [Diaporthe batatas]
MSGLAVRKKKGGIAPGAKRNRRDSHSDSEDDGDRPRGHAPRSEWDEDGDLSSEQDEEDQNDEKSDEEESEQDEVVRPKGRASRPPAKKQKLAHKATSGSSRAAPTRDLADIDTDESESSRPTRATGNGVVLQRPSLAFQTRKKEAKKQKRGMKPGDVKGDSSTDTAADELKDVYIPTVKAKASVVRRSRDFPPREQEDFKLLIPKPHYDEYWTREDERDLARRLSDDVNFKKQCEPKPIVVGLWKTVFRFTGWLVTDVIGPRTNLEFRSESQKGDGPIWTDRLCEALPDVVLHPMLDLDPAKAALALQWAVICRTGDKRKHRLSGCNDDIFLRFLASVVNKHQDGNTTPRYLRELALYKHKKLQDAGVGPPRWHELLRHIEDKVAETSQKKAPQGGEAADATHGVDGEPYFVNLADVYAVRSALDRIKHLSMRQYLGARLISGAVMPSRENSDVPNRELMQRAIKAVLLYKERNKERAARGGLPEPLPSPKPHLKRPSKDGDGSDDGQDSSDDDPFTSAGDKSPARKTAARKTARTPLQTRHRDPSSTGPGRTADSQSASPSLGESPHAPSLQYEPAMGVDDASLGEHDALQPSDESQTMRGDDDVMSGLIPESPGA